MIERIKKYLIQLYSDLVIHTIDLLVYHLKFTVFKVHRRSKQSLIRPSTKTIDTNEQMELLEIGRNNMTEFVKTVPDEVIVDLSHRWYCVRG